MENLIIIAFGFSLVTFNLFTHFFSGYFNIISVSVGTGFLLYGISNIRISSAADEIANKHCKKLIRYNSHGELQAISLSRPMGLLETWYLAHDPYQRNFLVVANIKAKDQLHIPNIEKIKNTARKIQMLHPCLQWTIDKARRSFVACNEEPKVVNEKSSWKQFVDHVLYENSNFASEGNKLLWSVHVFYSESTTEFQIIVHFHHIIVDGVSGCNFVAQFVALLSDETYVQKIAADSCPNVESIVDCKPKLYEAVYTAVQKLLIEKFYPKNIGYAPLDTLYNIQTIGKDVHCSPISWAQLLLKKHDKFKIDPFTIAAENLNPLCKKYRTTVHGALCAAVIYALNFHRNVFQSDRKSEHFASSITFPINIKKFASVVPDDTNLLLTVSVATFASTITALSNFWMVAKEISEFAAREAKTCAKLIGMLKLIPDLRQLIQEEVDKHHSGISSSAAFSNIGIIKNNAKPDDLTVEQLQLAQQVQFGSRSSVTFSAVTMNDVLSITAASPVPVVEGKFAAQITWMVMRVLEYVLNNDAKFKTSGSIMAWMELEWQKYNRVV